MKVLHYALGFPPYRTGGLTKFCMDLMKQQDKDGHQVALIWPGKMNFIGNKVSVHDRGTVSNIRSFEIFNPLPISYDEGIQDFGAFSDDCGKKAYDAFFSIYKPDVIHIHTLMGLHKSFILSAKQKSVRIVFTAHDYFPICPRITMFRLGQVCVSAENCKECGQCNVTALSISKIKLLQSPIYRTFKDSNIIKKIRKKHRDKYLSEKVVLKKSTVIKETSEEYLKLRAYYDSLLKLVDIIHYNSTVTKTVYERFFDLPKSITIEISHADIKDQRKKKNFTKYIKMTYLGAQSGAKGYFILKESLDRLWQENHDFELNVYFEPVEAAPYIKSHPRYIYSDLKDIFEMTDVLIAPSIWYETFGFTVLEALSCGVPVVLSGNVGAKDIVPEQAAIIIKDIDYEKLFRTLKSITANDLIDMNEAIIQNAKVLLLSDISKKIEKECYVHP